MRHANRTNVGILTGAQAAVVASIAREFSKATSEADVAELLTKATDAIDADVLAFVNHDGQWTRYGDHTRRPKLTGNAIDAVPVLEPGASTTTHIAGQTWTILHVSEQHGAAVILVEGDWTAGADPLMPLAVALARNVGVRPTITTITDDHALPAVDEPRRIGRSIYRMLRRLDRTRGLHATSEVALNHAVTAVRCRSGALALAVPPESSAVIVATHGYPLALVNHVRIQPGAGVIGTVLQSRRPILEDGSSVARRPRLRYRTNSFAAVPLLSGPDAIGALCVTDRADATPLTDGDVAILRLYAAAIVMAINRDRALESAEHAAHAAAIDPVTGVFNRQYLQVRLDEELQRSRRHDISIALLVIDIDNFKAVNDTYGHLVGDVALKDIAEILRRSVRVFDVCSRFGGDEFVIVMPGSTAVSAARIAERIRMKIEQYRPADRTLARLSVTVSVGLAVSSRDMAPAQLLERADRALYTAKNLGKNRVYGDEQT